MFRCRSFCFSLQFKKKISLLYDFLSHFSFFLFFSEAPCPHLSLPVEMDELMTSSSLNLAWPACQKCSARGDDSVVNDERRVECPNACLRGRALGLKGNGPALPVATPTELGASRMHYLQRALGGAVRLPRLPLQNVSEMFPEAGYGVEHQRNVPSEDEESLEQPLPLRSDVGESEHWIVGPGLTRSRTYSYSSRKYQNV